MGSLTLSQIWERVYRRKRRLFCSSPCPMLVFPEKFLVSSVTVLGCPTTLDYLRYKLKILTTSHTHTLQKWPNHCAFFVRRVGHLTCSSVYNILSLWMYLQRWLETVRQKLQEALKSLTVTIVAISKPKSCSDSQIFSELQEQV